MARSHYKFNPEDLNYNTLDSSIRARIWRIVIYVAAVLVIAIFLNVFYSLFFDTPRERQIRRENELLLEQYRSLNERKSMVDTVMQEVQRIDKDIYRVIFETEPIQKQSQESRAVTPFRQLLQWTNEEIVTYSTLRLDSMIDHTDRTASHYDVLMIKGENRSDMLPHIPAIQPIENRDLTLMASGFGNRIHPIYKIQKMHTGVDFSAPVGTPVFVTADGVVEVTARSGRGLGNRIVIDHGFGYKTMYSSLDEIRVRRGRNVKRGDVIGTVGDTGLSVAPHLHYEVHLNGEPVNPVNFFFLELSPRQYDQLIQISIKSGQSFD